MAKKFHELALRIKSVYAIIKKNQERGDDVAKNNLGVGVFKIENKRYGYRISIKGPDGKKKDSTFHLDMNGQPMTSANAAREDRAKRIAEIKNPTSVPNTVDPNPIKDCTLSDIWATYMKSTAPRKEAATVRKYESLWRVHVEPRFGSATISSITTNDIEDYLTELYCTKNYSYKYVEGFYKLFLQLFSLAFRDKHISRDTYFEMFEHPATKVNMPEIDQSDAEEYEKIETFTKGEISQIANILKDTNFYLPFLIAYTTGCRIGEVFGLMWDDYNFDTHILTIQRQMVREENEFVIKSVKTLQSVREVDVPPILHEELCNQRRKQNSKKANYKNPGLPTPYQAKVESSYVIDKTGKAPQKLDAPNFICRKETGEYMTPHSVKYWAKEIRAKLNIDFKFHKLRKTHLSYLAGMNVPAIELMKRAGHKKYETSMKYYINRSDESRKYLLNTIECINLRAPKYLVYFDPERKTSAEISEEVATQMLKSHGLIPKAYEDSGVFEVVEIADTDGGISPPTFTAVTGFQAVSKPPKASTPTADTGITSIHGDYRPPSVEELIEALNATGKAETAEAISAALSDKKD